MAEISPKNFYKIIQRKFLFEKFLKDLRVQLEMTFIRASNLKKKNLAVYLRHIVALHFGK